LLSDYPLHLIIWKLTQVENTLEPSEIVESLDKSIALGDDCPGPIEYAASTAGGYTLIQAPHLKVRAGFNNSQA
jgi:hypothetical protein